MSCKWHMMEYLGKSVSYRSHGWLLQTCRTCPGTTVLTCPVSGPLYLRLGNRRTRRTATSKSVVLLKSDIYEGFADINKMLSNSKLQYQFWNILFRLRKTTDVQNCDLSLPAFAEWQLLTLSQQQLQSGNQVCKKLTQCINKSDLSTHWASMVSTASFGDVSNKWHLLEMPWNSWFPRLWEIMVSMFSYVFKFAMWHRNCQTSCQTMDAPAPSQDHASKSLKKWHNSTHLHYLFLGKRHPHSFHLTTISSCSDDKTWWNSWTGRMISLC